MSRNRYQASLPYPELASSPSRLSNILSPVGHAGVMAGLAFAWVVLASAAIAWQRQTLDGRGFVFILLASAALSVSVGAVSYYFRDKWFRDKLWPLEEYYQQDLNGDGATGDPETPAEWLRQERGPNWVQRLKLPAEWGITEQKLAALAGRVDAGNLAYSRRELAGTISEEFYTQFSEMLRGNGLLAAAPNKSYAWTRAGIAWCKQVVKEKDAETV